MTWLYAKYCKNVNKESISMEVMILIYICKMFVVCGECKYKTDGGRLGRTSAVSSLDKRLQKI